MGTSSCICTNSRKNLLFQEPLANWVPGLVQLIHMLPFDMAHAEPDGVERGKEGERQHRADGRASDQHISHRSPKHGMCEWNKCQHCGQRGQDDWSRPLDGGLDNRMIWVEAIGLIGMNLTDQNERVPHQNT